MIWLIIALFILNVTFHLVTRAEDANLCNRPMQKPVRSML